VLRDDGARTRFSLQFAKVLLDYEVRRWVGHADFRLARSQTF